MTESLTASKKWCKFDDDFKEKNGYRLPADPYLLAPPQGSIIPVWHRGGAPNYQRKPMISTHVQDPVKAWRRERHMWQPVPEPPKLMTFSQMEAAFPRLINREMAEVTVEEIEDSSDDDSDAISLTSTLFEQKTIAIYFCSTGTIAEKLAKKVHKRIEALVKVSLNVALQPRVECLNKLKATDMTADKIFLLVVSSIGEGEVPPNGSGFLRVTRLSSIEGMSFSVSGNRDSRYSATYNGVAKAVHQHMQHLGGRSLIRKILRGDIAVEPIPYTAVNNWWNSLEPKVYDLINKDEAIVVDYGSKLEALNETITVVNDAVDRLIDHGRDLFFFKDAFTVAAQPFKPDPAQRSLKLFIDIGSTRYEDHNCIQILPLNHPSKVDRALKVLKLDGAATLDLSTHKDNPTYATFLSKIADLEVPFKRLDWLLNMKDSSASSVKELLSNFTVLETLELLAKTNLLSRFLTKSSLVQDIILTIPLLHTRTCSVASSLSAEPTSPSTPDANTVDIMLKRIPNGRFSSTFLIDHSTSPAKLQYRFVDSVTGPRLRHLSVQTDKPFVIVATGAGFGPVECLLQSRIAAARCAKSAIPAFEKMSLFLGFHPTDIPLVKPTLDDAEELGLTDEWHIVESNPAKRRVQDLLVRYDMAGKLRDKLIGEKEG